MEKNCSYFGGILKVMKIIGVTGSSGFIGSYLVNALKINDYTVIEIDLGKRLRSILEC